MKMLKYSCMCLIALLWGMQQVTGQTSIGPDTLKLFQEAHLFPDKAERDSLFTPAQMYSITSLGLYTANGREDLTEIGNKLEDVPYVVVKRQSFLEGIKAVKGLQSKITEYGKLDTAYQELEAIDGQRWAVYDTIIKEERNRTALFIDANKQLNTQIDSLNSQFLAASEVTRKAIKGRNSKTGKMGFVGGIIGLSAGILLGIIGTN